MILTEIVEQKKKTLEREIKQTPLEDVVRQSLFVAPPPSFRGGLSGAGLSLIGEVKRASPSLGMIREDFDPVREAGRYLGQVEAVSVLTEEDYFLGAASHLRRVASRYPGLPLLRKDFVIAEYQIYQARALGASAVLLIAAILARGELERMIRLTRSLGMDPLVEVHDHRELEMALEAGADLVGINNRNLQDFSVSLETTLQLAPLVPPDVVLVSESGIRDGRDTAKLRGSGVRAILVGESFMRSPDPAGLARNLRDGYVS